MLRQVDRTGQQRSLSLPEVLLGNGLAISKEVVHPDHQPIEFGNLSNTITDGIVKQTGRFVERACPHAVVAVHPVLDPEEETSFRIDIPFRGAGEVGCGGALERRFSEGNGP